MNGQAGQAGGLSIRQARTEEDLEAIHRLRIAVFVEEQHVPLGEELDGHDHDDGVAHLLAQRDGQCVATARLLDTGTEHVHVTRVAVARRARSQGLGRALMQAAEALALERSPHGQVWLELSAQISAADFYRGLGYDLDEDRYLDAGIWHVDARKFLSAT